MAIDVTSYWTTRGVEYFQVLLGFPMEQVATQQEYTYGNDYKCREGKCTDEQFFASGHRENGIK